MEISRSPQLVMEAALQLRSARAQVLAANVANADTPGYHAGDIDFDRALQGAIASGVTAPNLTSKGAMVNLRYDQNDVDASTELAKAYQNSLSYVATLKLYGDSVQRERNALSSS
jgi:flagellar basal-body rod protein FlgB